MADTLKDYMYDEEEADRSKIKPEVKIERIIYPKLKLKKIKPDKDIFAFTNNNNFMEGYNPFGKKTRKHNFLGLRSDFYRA